MLCAVEVLTTESIFTLCFCAPHTPQLAFLMHQPQMLSSLCSLVANSRSPQLLSLENFSCSKQDLSIFKNSALVQCVTGCYNFSVFWINPIQYTTYLGNLLHISKFLSKSTYLHIYISTYLQEVVNSSHQRAGVNLSIPESPSKNLDFNSQKPSSFYSKRSTFWTNKQKVFSFCSTYPVGLAKKFDIKLFLSKKFRKINPNPSVCYYTLLSDHQFKSKVSLFHFCLFQLSFLKNE